MAVDCHGEERERAGGLVLRWKNSLKVELKSPSLNHMDVVVIEIETEKIWRASGIYDFPEAARKT